MDLHIIVRLALDIKSLNWKKLAFLLDIPIIVVE